MFDKDFYPTPEELAERLVLGLDIENKVVLEPSAGKGDLVDVINRYMPKEILACERNEELCSILHSKCEVIGNDFLELDKKKVSHINCIVANPPFSKQEDHILKMWEISPGGCEIRVICNSTMIERSSYSDTSNKHKIKKIISEFGSYEVLENAFSHAERKTDVSICIIKLFKPGVGENEFDGYFDMREEYEEDHGKGIIRHNEIREIVNRYVGAVKRFDEVESLSNDINELMKPIVGEYDRIEFGSFYSKNRIGRDRFKKELQKKSWHLVFKKMDIGRYLTSSIGSEINTFVEKQENVPFTMTNIHKMVMMIVGTVNDRMNRVFIEVFDNLTKHYSENRYSVEGWKTNSHYLVNKKFILNSAVKVSYFGDMECGYNSSYIDDFIKALCYNEGVQYKENYCLSDYINYSYRECQEDILCNEVVDCRDKKQFGVWFDLGEFFEAKAYKKGTIHIRFKDENVWARFNRKVAEIKGFPLPEKI